MYLLDTDTLSRYHAGSAIIVARVRDAGEENVATTIVTAIEVLRGRHEYLLKAADGPHLLQAQRLLNLSEELLLDFVIISVESRAAAEFDRLRANKKLKKIGRADLLIACIAISRGAVIVTRNIKHFQMVPGLKVENWLD